MNILLIEWITGGGLYPDPLTEHWVNAGESMRSALIQDLLMLSKKHFLDGNQRLLALQRFLLEQGIIPEAIKIITLQDKRIPSPQFPVQFISVPFYDKQFSIGLAEVLTQMTAVWLIAPETGQVLFNWTKFIEEKLFPQQVLLSCPSNLIALTGDKWEMYRVLCIHHISTPQTYLVSSNQGTEFYQLDNSSAWVAKPRDGANCENTFYFNNTKILQTWLKKQDVFLENFIIQSYEQGIHASLSLFFYRDQWVILNVNQQNIIINKGVFQFHGVKIGRWNHLKSLFIPLVEQLKIAFPTMYSYVGVDIIFSLAGGSLHFCKVIEINPRLTTSYK